jgi:WD40 repeat protein
MKRITVTKIAHFSGHKGAVFTLENSVNENCFYSGGDDGYVAEWNMSTKGDGKLIVQTPRPVYSLCCDREIEMLYCGTAAGNLHVVDLKSGKEIRNIEAHTLGLYDIKQTKDRLYTAGGDGRVCVWRKSDMALLHIQQYSDKSARVISIHPELDEIAVGYSDFKIRLMKAADSTLLAKLDAHNNSVFALSYSPDGNYLLSGGRDVMLRSWKRSDGYSMEMDIPAHRLQIKCITFSPDRMLFATCSMDKTIKIWDGHTFQLIKVIDKERNDSHINCINKIIWMNDRTLVSCSDDKQVMGFELKLNDD